MLCDIYLDIDKYGFYFLFEVNYTQNVQTSKIFAYKRTETARLT